MTQAAEVKETKAQRAERLKREKNPWEAFNEVREFARAGRSSVVPEWAICTSNVGHLHAGRWRGCGRRQGRRGRDLRLVHDAHRHSQRHCVGRPTAGYRRADAQYARNLAGHYRAAKHSTSLAHDRGSAGDRGYPGCIGPFAERPPVGTWCAT